MLCNFYYCHLSYSCITYSDVYFLSYKYLTFGEWSGAIRGHFVKYWFTTKALNNCILFSTRPKFCFYLQNTQNHILFQNMKLKMYVDIQKRKIKLKFFFIFSIKYVKKKFQKR